MKGRKRSNITGNAAAGAVLVLIILVAGTIWMGQIARKDTQDAVRTVSNLYLDELAGRREQVLESNLQNKIRDLRVAVSLMDREDLSDMDHLQDYQDRMKKHYNLDKFAFVDSRGRIYTTEGMQTNIDEYSFDYKTLSGPEVSILNLNTPEKKVVIAEPVEMSFEGETLMVCFMEIDMKEMLSGVSMESNREEVTFCNIYTRNGVALSNTVLGGLAAEDNLLDAMKQAEYDEGYSFENFLQTFQNGERGEVSFNYKGIDETLSFVQVKDTDWMLTYLIRESVLSEKISGVTAGLIRRSVLQSIATVAALVLMFGYIPAGSDDHGDGRRLPQCIPRGPGFGRGSLLPGRPGGSGSLHRRTALCLSGGIFRLRGKVCGRELPEGIHGIHQSGKYPQKSGK